MYYILPHNIYKYVRQFNKFQEQGPFLPYFSLLELVRLSLEKIAKVDGGEG